MKFLTKALVAAGVMVGALAMSSMCAWAAKVDYEFMPSADENTNDIPEWLLFNNETSGWKKGQTPLEDDTIVGAFNEKIFGNTGAVKGQYKYENGNRDDTFTIKTTGKNASVELYLFRNSNSNSTSLKSVYVNGIPSSCNEVIYSYRLGTAKTEKPITYEMGDAGEYKFFFNNSGVCVYKIVLKDEEKPAETISTVITAKNSITNEPVEKFVISYNSTTYSPDSGGKYALKANTEYTVSANGYVSQTFTLSSSDTEKEIELTPNNYKTYTLSGSDLGLTDKAYQVGDVVLNEKFLVGNYVRYNNSKIEVNENSAVKIFPSAASRLTISGIKAGGDSNRTLVVKKDGTPVNFSGAYDNLNTSSSEHTKSAPENLVLVMDANRVYTITAKKGDGSTDSEIGFDSLSVTGQFSTPTTEFKLLAPTSSKPAVISFDNKYYALTVVTEEQANNSSSVSINGKSSESIYKEAQFSDPSRTTVLNASLLGGSGNIYGVELEIINPDNKEITLKDLQDKLTVEFK
ncbi:MAG TPA: hypothetical protein DCG28_03405 [Lachnospiraceae bacterium]|nr:hypothetical protein [Lachnospiraceae bacterium]